jgi:excisionase family DNA binding protein
MVYDMKESAQILKVSCKTINRAVADGRLKCHRIGAALRFTKADLENFFGAPLFSDREKPDHPENRGIIPGEIIKRLEAEISGISHGVVSLTVHLRDKRPRFVIAREQSFMPETFPKEMSDYEKTTEKV